MGLVTALGETLEKHFICVNTDVINMDLVDTSNRYQYVARFGDDVRVYMCLWQRWHEGNGMKGDR